MNHEQRLELVDKMAELTKHLPDELDNMKNQEELDVISESYRQIVRENLSYRELVELAVIQLLNVANEHLQNKRKKEHVIKALSKAIEETFLNNNKKEED